MHESPLNLSDNNNVNKNNNDHNNINDNNDHLYYLKVNTNSEAKLYAIYISWFKTTRLQFLLTSFSELLHEKFDKNS